MPRVSFLVLAFFAAVVALFCFSVDRRDEDVDVDVDVDDRNRSRSELKEYGDSVAGMMVSQIMDWEVCALSFLWSEEE